MVPYAVRHPGITLSELSDVFDVPEDTLRADFDLLTMTGVPPYDPGTLIDFDLDELDGGRVTLRMADHLDKPARLTRPEAISLYLRGKALLATPGLREAPALASALAKIERGVDDETVAELASRVQAASEIASSEILETVREAVGSGNSISIDYYAVSTDEFRTRTVDPEKVYNESGRWYLVAWDREADDERLFRVERIRSVAVTGETFESRGLQGAGRDLYSASDADLNVRLRLHPGGRWVGEYYQVDSAEEDGSDLIVTMPAGSLAGLSKLVLLLGPNVEVLEPAALQEAASELARRALEHYTD